MSHTIIICAGDFWEAEDFFATIPGVIYTDVGYAGGTYANPMYHSKGDHLEAVRIEFNDRIINFEEILALLCEYVASFNITKKPVVFYFSEIELRRMEQWRETATNYELNAAEVEFLPLTNYHVAENYHQHYLAKLRGEDIAKNNKIATDLQK